MGNQGNIAKLDFLMSPDRDCGVRGNKVTYRYLLCSTPRCGSNLVSDMLQQTGLAGDPLEYINSRYIASYLRSKGLPVQGSLSVNAYLSEIEQRRSTANGYFGIKVHFEHLHALFPKSIDDSRNFLGGFDQIVLLRRRDKLSQAVSLYRARVTQIWSSLDYQFLSPNDERLSRQVVFDPAAIANALHWLLQQELGWLTLLERLGLPFHTLWYEDMVSNYQGTSELLLSWLGLSDSVATIHDPSLKKQRAECDPFLTEFRQIIGVE